MEFSRGANFPFGRRPRTLALRRQNQERQQSWSLATELLKKTIVV
jgi:hypothetical protein